ncbi:helix-turn-helix transcriptional regulator [Pseudomonas sp. 2FE]|uniref:ArsR/SmtB family transcription factor n=1 Tax=Pseudomonas sp. 2FE TaxID=2502190 RepID=UPI0010F77892|nr:metalloregulator ArsR/SmtB family transcription factor [Pseudomonas sp. 2FE]
MSSDQLSSTFAALADPTRRAILARLAAGETTVTELAEPFEMTLPAVTKHLKVLERAGLISRSREAQWRPCRLEAKPLEGVADWVGQYRQFWEARLDRLEDYLRELQAQATTGETPEKPTHNRRENNDERKKT